MSGPDAGPDVHAVLTGLRRLAEQAGSAAATARRGTALIPQTARAADSSGAVSVTVDADGLPTAVVIRDDWPARLSPGGFGAAVTAACRAAEHARLVEWGDRLADADLHAPPPAPATTTGGPSPGVPAGSVTDLHRRLRAVDRMAPDPAPRNTPVVGRAANGRLTVTITRNGLHDCSADPAWVAGRSAAHLADTVGEAVRDARRRQPDNDDDTARIEELRRIADDVLATLHALSGGPSRPRGPGTPARPGAR